MNHYTLMLIGGGLFFSFIGIKIFGAIDKKKKYNRAKKAAERR